MRGVHHVLWNGRGNIVCDVFRVRHLAMQNTIMTGAIKGCMQIIVVIEIVWVYAVYIM